MHPLEQTLNSEQRRAIRTTEGPVLILAGAGSGKTKTLTHRIAWLIQEKGVSPQNILAVTFTNKAAQEMRERVLALFALTSPQSAIRPNQPVWRLENQGNLPHMGTFHHICALLLRKEIAPLGYTPSFNIIDDGDQLAIVKKTLKDLDLNPDQFQPRALLSAISRAKNSLLDPETHAQQTQSYYDEVSAQVYTAYQEFLERNNSLDFDDLIRLTVKIFRAYPSILKTYQQLFRYLMVDEYQDTNHAQYTLIRLLSEKHRNLFVIGDDYQSIYGWRQADIRNILNFEKDYPEAEIITLEQNYRSTQIILDAAHSIIRNNERQRHKKLWTEKSGGEPILLVSAQDEHHEAEYVSQEIRRLRADHGYHYADCAILYRTNSQSRVLEELFLHNNIPYKIVGGIRFYERKEIKDVLAYLKLIYNPNDLLSLERIVNEPKRGIGSLSLGKWIHISIENGISPLAMTEENLEKSSLRKAKIKSILEFSAIINTLRGSITTHTGKLGTFIQRVIRETGYEKTLSDGTPEAEIRAENVKELLSVAKKFDDFAVPESLKFFLDEVALASDTDTVNQNHDMVHLMTLHSSKGLEFPVVFLVGLEEGIFPHSRSQFSSQELEEERRLMYVGLTRARERAYLIHASMRTIFGSTQINPPSRFLSEIDNSLIQKKIHTLQGNKHFLSPKKNEPRKKKLPSQETFRPGDSVSHPDFGHGVVIALQGTIISVAFKKKGVKKLALGITPLSKL